MIRHGWIAFLSGVGKIGGSRAGISRGFVVGAICLGVTATAGAAEISSFQAGDGGWQLGCKFEEKLSWSELLLFG